MKLTDLAILDWVLVNNTPHRIQAIDSIDAEIQADDELYYVGEDRCHSEDKIEGIPITPEILKKNGFSFIKSSNTHSVWNGQWIYENLELGTCCLDREGNWPCFINIDDMNIKCEYVHQLQHALRLCGLNELANNFKV